MSTDLVQDALELAPVDLFEAYCEVDRALVAAGWHPTTQWWLDVLRIYLRSRKRRLVCRVGRRGGKSDTMCRLICTLLVWVRWKISHGHVGVVPVVSVDKGEAKERIRTISAILHVLKVEHETTTEEIKLARLPLVVRVYPARINTVGFDGIAILADEMARWRDDATGANPARDVLTSMRPSLAGVPGARELFISSPWGTIDAHYDAVEKGDTAEQVVAIAPTWVARPNLPEAECRELEPDEPSFRREYGAEPMQAGEATFFPADVIANCVEDGPLPRAGQPGDRTMAGGDWGFTRNSSAVVVCHLASSRVYHVAEMLELAPLPGQPLKPSEVAARAAEVITRHGANILACDTWSRESMDEHLQHHGCNQIAVSASPAEQYTRLRTLMAQGLVHIPAHDQLVRDLSEVKSAPLPSGGLRIILPKRPGGSHADLVSALALAVWQLTGPPALLAPAPKVNAEEQRMFAEHERRRGIGAVAYGLDTGGHQLGR